MSQLPTGAAAAPLAGDVPATQPQTSPAVQQQQAPPPQQQAAQQHTQAAGNRALNMDDVIQVPGPDGQMRTATVGQLMDAASRSISPDQVDAFQEFVKNRDTFNLFQGIQKGDRDAILSLFGAGDQQGQQAQNVDPAQRVAELEGRIAQLNQMVERMNPTIEQINTLREQTNIRQAIANNGERLPYLASALKTNPEIVNKVHQNLETVRTLMRANGMDPGTLTPQQQHELGARVLMATEQDIMSTASTFGVRINPQNHATNVQVQDDQLQNRQQQGVAPGIRMQNGRLVDRQGRPVIQTESGQFVPLAIDSHIPGTTATGVSGGVNAPGGRQRVDPAGLMASMKAHLQAATGAQQ